MELQNWKDIEDKKGREKGDNQMRESNMGETCMKRIKTRKGGKKE